jgi:hypothetical protein
LKLFQELVGINDSSGKGEYKNNIFAVL